MACMTFKRPLEQDPMHNYPGGPSKRARFTQNPGRSPSTTMAGAGGDVSGRAHQQQQRDEANGNGYPPSSSSTSTSPFAELQSGKLTSDKMAANIREETQRMKRRIRFSSSNVDFEVPMHHAAMMDSSSSAAASASADSTDDKQLFTTSQVGFICQRMLEEQEQRIREEYDKLLAERLAEQYDTFIKFTQDQIQAKFQNAKNPSYLS